MKYIEAPNKSKPKVGTPTLFLGGGITSCKNWQSNLVELLTYYNVTIYNPRRNNFDINNAKASEEQIKWEHKYLHEVDIIVFYFAEETLCPITLLELGAALERNTYSKFKQNILIYCEPEYKRKFDVELQSKLAINYARKLKNVYLEDIDGDLMVTVYDDYYMFVEHLIQVINDNYEVI